MSSSSCSLDESEREAWRMSAPLPDSSSHCVSCSGEEHRRVRGVQRFGRGGRSASEGEGVRFVLLRGLTPRSHAVSAAVHLWSPRRSPVHQAGTRSRPSPPAEPRVLRRGDVSFAATLSVKQPRAQPGVSPPRRSRWSCRLSCTRSTTFSSPSTTSAVTATARRKTWWRLQVGCGVGVTPLLQEL